LKTKDLRDFLSCKRHFSRHFLHEVDPFFRRFWVNAIRANPKSEIRRQKAEKAREPEARSSKARHNPNLVLT
jgi:hypothetical protein